jgi:transposase
MARPYSQDLRNRVVSSLASGRTCRATAALFGVSVASVVKWSQRWRASGSAAAKPMGGSRPLRLKTDPRTIETSRRNIGDLLGHFTPAECANYLANAGYASA